jgi:hypothetical protein
VIWIDVYHAWKNLINMTHTLSTLVHIHPTYTSCGQSPYMATFYKSSTELDRVTAPEKKGLLTQSTAHQLIDLRGHTQLLSRANQWSSRKRQTSINSRLLGLSGPYHQHAIGTFNTCSRRSTHPSIIDTGGSWNLRGAGLLHHTPRPSQPTVLSFPPKGPAQSPI